MASFSYTYITSSSILEQGDHIFKEKLITSGLSVVLSLSKKEEFLALGQQDGTNLFSFAFLTHISNISAWLINRAVDHALTGTPPSESPFYSKICGTKQKIKTKTSAINPHNSTLAY